MNYLDEIMRQLDDLRRQVAALQRIEALTDATYVKLAGRSGGQRVSGIASTGYALEVYRDLAAASTNSAVFAVTQDNASDDQDALRVQQDGSGDVVELLDGATVVLRVLDGGRLDVYNIIRALTASGLRLEDDGGNLGLFVEDGGNVGINTAAPDDQIHIAGNVRISGTNIIQLKPGTAGSLEVLDVTTPTSNKNVGIRLLPSGTATRSQIEMWNDSDTANGGRVNLSVSGDTMLFEPAVGGTGTDVTKIAFSSGDVIFGGTTPSGQLHVDQSSTTGAKPVLVLDQADLSEEFIEFVTTVGAGNPVNTTALGAYYGRVRVSVNGTFKWLALYD